MHLAAKAVVASSAVKAVADAMAPATAEVARAVVEETAVAVKAVADVTACAAKSAQMAAQPKAVKAVPTTATKVARLKAAASAVRKVAPTAAVKVVAKAATDHAATIAAIRLSKQKALPTTAAHPLKPKRQTPLKMVKTNAASVAHATTTAVATRLPKALKTTRRCKARRPTMRQQPPLKAITTRLPMAKPANSAHRASAAAATAMAATAASVAPAKRSSHKKVKIPTLRHLPPLLKQRHRKHRCEKSNLLAAATSQCL